MYLNYSSIESAVGEQPLRGLAECNDLGTAKGENTCAPFPGTAFHKVLALPKVIWNEISSS